MLSVHPWGAKMYTIDFTVGDWSGDGHNQKETFLVSSSRSIKELRELHFKAEEYLDFAIGDICADYEQSYIESDQLEQLQALEIVPEDFVNEDLEADDILELWLAILNYVAKMENLDIVLFYNPKTTERYPAMHFYGYDEKKRHLGVPGYGVFLP